MQYLDTLPISESVPRPNDELDNMKRGENMNTIGIKNEGGNPKAVIVKLKSGNMLDIALMDSFRELDVLTIALTDDSSSESQKSIGETSNLLQKISFRSSLPIPVSGMRPCSVYSKSKC